MHKNFIKTAAFIGAFSVVLGAFGAHQLASFLSPKAMAIFETAVRYLFYHVLALLAVGILYQYFPNKLVRAAGSLFILGIILFSGSLLLLTYKEAMNVPLLKWAGPITPIGGACFIAGWVCLALGIKK
ncbi:MAG: DUF423 domain-containing protein [Chitinophagaceae bacterium]|nr:DUF423 domain-containing protein [Chitinophagaceae bacterium]